MRSPIGPVLVVLGLATTLIVVLVLFQSIGMRNDLERARGEVAALQARVDAQSEGVTRDELRAELDELRELIEASAVTDPGGDVGTPAGGTVTYDEVVDRLDEVLARINELNDRVDEICRSVPIC